VTGRPSYVGRFSLFRVNLSTPHQAGQNIEVHVTLSLLASRVDEVRSRVRDLSEGVGDLPEGVGDLSEGVGDLFEGVRDLSEGVRDLSESVGYFPEGVATHSFACMPACLTD